MTEVLANLTISEPKEKLNEEELTEKEEMFQLKVRTVKDWFDKYGFVATQYGCNKHQVEGIYNDVHKLFDDILKKLNSEIKDKCFHNSYWIAPFKINEINDEMLTIGEMQDEMCDVDKKEVERIINEKLFA